MLAVLEFVFASGWHFAGSIALLGMGALIVRAFCPIRISINED